MPSTGPFFSNAPVSVLQTQHRARALRTHGGRACTPLVEARTVASTRPSCRPRTAWPGGGRCYERYERRGGATSSVAVLRAPCPRQIRAAHAGASLLSGPHIVSLVRAAHAWCVPLVRAAHAGASLLSGPHTRPHTPGSLRTAATELATVLVNHRIRPTAASLRPHAPRAVPARGEEGRQAPRRLDGPAAALQPGGLLCCVSGAHPSLQLYTPAAGADERGGEAASTA